MNHHGRIVRLTKADGEQHVFVVNEPDKSKAMEIVQELWVKID